MVQMNLTYWRLPQYNGASLLCAAQRAALGAQACCRGSHAVGACTLALGVQRCLLCMSCQWGGRAAGWRAPQPMCLLQQVSC